MACKDAYDYRLVDDEASLKEALSELKGDLERNTRLAVDCEGVNLSRKGALTIITVATEEKAYIFDVLTLGKAVFTGGFGEILEDKSREKLMFDCRQDSDALWHQFNVKLTGVLDLQLLEIMCRRENAAASHTSSYKRRSQKTDEVEKIYGFARCLELYVQDKDLIKMKEKGKKVMQQNDENGDNNVWKKRPLSDELIQYCFVDTMGMFRLYEKMKDVYGREEARLRVASERYVDHYRGLTERCFDEYETNAYLPLDIIPDKGRLGFAAANTACTLCYRKFPREEFSNTQLRQGEQKCRVCKEIKRLDDVQKNREDNWDRAEEYYWRRAEEYEDYYVYSSDDELNMWW